MFALEGGEHLSQQCGELCLFVVVERGEERSFVGEVLGRYLVDQLDAFRGELDEQPAAVLGVWDAPDQAVAFEPVEAVGHRSGGAHQREVELGGREAMRRSTALEAGQHIPGAAAESELAESSVDAGVDVCGDAAEAGDYRDRREVEIAVLLRPLLEHAIHVVSVDTEAA